MYVLSRVIVVVVVDRYYWPLLSVFGALEFRTESRPRVLYNDDEILRISETRVSAEHHLRDVPDVPVADGD